MISLIGLFGCGDSPGVVTADALTLVYSANVDGEIEPCG